MDAFDVVTVDGRDGASTIAGMIDSNLVILDLGGGPICFVNSSGIGFRAGK